MEEAAKPDFWTFLTNGVKQGGLNMRNQVVAVMRLCQSSMEATTMLVKSLLKGMALDTVKHRECVKEAQRKRKKEQVEAKEAGVQRQMAAAKTDVWKRLERNGECGAWIASTLDKIQGTLLSRDNMRDSLCLRYAMHPLDLQDHCNAFVKAVSIEHGLSCKTGGRVGLIHNNVRDKAGGSPR